ncbi:MAG: M20/M25/M40 family metallo-hydrolase [Planctomycetales bacterium]
MPAASMKTTAKKLPGVARAAAVRRAMDLMAIPGKSKQESRVAEYIVARLRDAGIPQSAISFDASVRDIPGGGEIGNLIVKLPGMLKAPRRMLMAHMDTVPLCVGARPVRKGPVIVSKDAHTALGADDRAGASVVLTAALEILRQKLPHPPLTLFWPVQEEIGLYGARFADLSKLGQPELCFNWDGGDPEVAVTGATGDYNMEIEIAGIASHAGVHPEHGVSAIAVAGLAVADLVENGWHGLIQKGKHTGTSNIGFVHAGEATNVVTPHLRLHAEVRSHDPKFRQRLRDEFENAFVRAAKKVKNSRGETAKVRFVADLKYESFRLDENQPCVRSAFRAIEAVGLTPCARISNGGLDANWTSARGLPTVTLGAGMLEVHTVNEALDIEQYLHACRIGLLLATAAV